MYRSRSSRYPRQYSPPPPRRRGPYPRTPSPSSMKIFPVYVGNIAKDASVSDLRAVFGRFGNVLEVTVISEHGFVTFDTVEEASEAVRSLDGFQMCGKTLEVDYSDEMKAYFARQNRKDRSRSPSHRQDPSILSARRHRLPSQSPPFSRQETPLPTSSRRFEMVAGRRSRRLSSPNDCGTTAGRVSSSGRDSRSSGPSPSRSNPSDERRRSDTRSKSPPPKRKRYEGGTSVGSSDVEVEINEVGGPNSSKVDLREFLKKKKLKDNTKLSESPTLSTSTSAEVDEKTCEKEIIRISADGFRRVASVGPSKRHMLYIGNLFNPVEKSDLERLLDGHGKVLEIGMFDSFALVDMEMDLAAAEKAIEELNGSLWMDNNIKVKFNGPRPKKPPSTHAKYGHCDRTYEDDKYGSAEKEEAFAKDAEVGESEKSKQPERKVKKTRTYFVYSATTPKSFLVDLKDIFSGFGKVLSCDRHSEEDLHITVEVVSTQRQALKCIREVNEIKYKGGNLRVKFAEWEEEDTADFRGRHILEFRQYPIDSVLPPNVRAKSKMPTQAKKTHDSAQVPIGVLPPSSSLGAFGAADSKALSSLLQNLQHQAFKNQQRAAAAAQVGPMKPPPTQDPDSVTSVEGEIRSVHAKIVIIHFHTGFSAQIAKCVPGQMYINGRRSLGCIIKNNQAHTWPAPVKRFLHEGSRVLMDAKKLTVREITETAQLTEDHVTYSATLLWKAQRPEDVFSATTQSSTVLKAVVDRIHPKWGVAKHDQKGYIFFNLDSLYVKSKRDSLLEHLIVGDLVAVNCKSVEDYLDMAEEAKGQCGFTGSTADLKYRALLVWRIETEVDPYVVGNEKRMENEEDCDFLATSSTLTRQLPSEKESLDTGWPGVVEEVHAPAGGVILLDESLGLDKTQRRVYFHRSRCNVNGIKLSSGTDITVEIVPGDSVTVDVLPNVTAGSDSDQPPFVEQSIARDVFWMALSMHLNNRSRGTRIAKSLRTEGAELSGKNDVYMGRIIHLARPVEDEGPAEAGTAVIDTGEYAGQRVEFERRQCTAFGLSMAKADLSQILSFGAQVYIRVKPYNSYCVESLYVGFEDFSARRDDISPQQNDYMRAYLSHHGLDDTTFTQLAQGKFPSRKFLPLPGQQFIGKVKEVKRSRSSNDADIAVIEAHIGLEEPLIVEVPRSRFSVYGHWMTKADLRYLIENDEVLFEYNPSLDINRNKASAGSYPEASLVWLGNVDDRPVYAGRSTQVNITPGMDSSLWAFVAAKKMDEKMFRALIEGRLPPKPEETVGSECGVVSVGGKTFTVDEETLAQAALLKQMKSSFGTTAMLQAMMTVMAGTKESKEGKSANLEKLTKDMLEKCKEGSSSQLSDEADDKPSTSSGVKLIWKK